MQRREIPSFGDQGAARLAGSLLLLGILSIGIWLAAFGYRYASRVAVEAHARAELQRIVDASVHLLEGRHRELESLCRNEAAAAVRGEPPRKPAALDLLARRLPGLYQLSRLDLDGRPLWSTSGPAAASNVDLFDLRVQEQPRAAPTFHRARRNGSVHSTPALELNQEDWGFLTFLPVMLEGEVVGMLAAAFRFRDVLGASFDPEAEPRLDLRLVYDDTEVLRLPDDEPPSVDPDAPIGASPGPYVARVGPGPDPTDFREAVFEIDEQRYRIRLRAVPSGLPRLLDSWPAIVAAHLLALALVWASHRLLRRRDEHRARSHLMDGVFSNLPVTAFSIAPDGEVERSFGKAAVGLGLSSGGGETLDDFPALVRPLQRALAGESMHLEADLAVEGGETRTFELFLLHDDLRGAGALGFAIDVSARKWVEKALQRNEERYRRFFREAPFAYLALDLDGRIELANALAAELTGYSAKELTGLPCSRLFAEDEPWADPAQREEIVRNREVELLRADGSTFWGSLSLQPLRDDFQFVGSILIVLDITERKRLQEQVRQSQKMEAVGRLAGGIAHDFNNLLTAIMGYARMALKRVDEDPRLQRDLEEIQKACRRATSLVSQLLAFSRRQIVEPKVFNLNELLRDMDPMLRRLIREEVDLASHLAADLGHIRMDPGQMEQVVVNLVVNAQEAIAAGGWVTVETDNHVDKVEGGATDMVRLRISDTGSGMSPEVQEHIFEPFFTTKEDLSGTGLGLATVYGIVVEQCSGRILVDSEVGEGTTITILLPRVYDEVDLEDEPPPPAEPSLGNEKILLVEDEEMVRELAAEMLLSLGYEVIQAKNGLDALDVVDGREHELDLLLTDVVMPKMGGEKLYLELRRRNPELRVLYSSGYTESAVIHHGVKEGEVPFVHKPYTFDSLAQAVQTTLKS